MDEKNRELVNLLKEKKGAAVDIVPIISDFTLFTICGELIQPFAVHLEIIV